MLRALTASNKLCVRGQGGSGFFGGIMDSVKEVVLNPFARSCGGFAAFLVLNAILFIIIDYSTS